MGKVVRVKVRTIPRRETSLVVDVKNGDENQILRVERETDKRSPGLL